jgi:hypothetical protein
MMQSKFKTACLMAGALLAAVPGVANAETTELEQMRAEMAQMRAEMAQLKADSQGDWMSDVRRAEIEGMIADVFADAESRATLLQEGALAGIDEKGKVFLQSADGGFSMNINGQIQFRYIFNNVEDRVDESVSGFQIRRTKLGVKGKVADGWGYALKFQVDRNSGNVAIDEAKITKKLSDELSFSAGNMKLPFARQELISSSRQVSVDRGLATEFFTLGRSDSLHLKYASGDIAVTTAFSDGANAGYTDWNADAANDFAVTGRVDWMAIGDDWGAMKHEFGGVDEDALFIGAAAHYEVADGSGVIENGLAWTVDALYKTGALGLSAAIFGNSTENVAAGTDTDQFGFYAQASVDLGNDWDIFGRYDFIDDDDNAGAGTDELQAVTFGFNRHFNKNVKFTGDVVYIFSGDNPLADGNTSTDGEDSDGIGLVGAVDGDDQIALRLQLQLLF